MSETPWWLEDDDEVAAPLTDAQIEELHSDLLALRVVLQEQLEAPSDRTKTVDLDQPIGRVSRIDALQQQKMAQAQRTRLRQRLSQAAVAPSASAARTARRGGAEPPYRRLELAPTNWSFLSLKSALNVVREP